MTQMTSLSISESSNHPLPQHHPAPPPSANSKDSASLSKTRLWPSISTAAACPLCCCRSLAPMMRLLLSPNNNNKKHHHPISAEVYQFVALAIPNIIIQWSFVLPPAVVASHIGVRLGVVALDGYTLAWGTGNLGTMRHFQCL
mmetsp:Transcript_21154/g.58566  ORF Transcript_21154/g.58566 Transcript_21154/m.58566 type:complete len:143 (+) Transcript_21154:166-594(+)